METVNNLGDKLSISKISRFYIYYNRKNTVKHKKSRISENIINRIFEISRDKITHGYGKVRAVIINGGTKINIKMVRKIIKSKNLIRQYAKH